MNKDIKQWDCIVIGAGAAGLMASIELAEYGRSTLLLDSQKQVGAKILMSGGTRCNVTNRAVTEKDYCSEHPKVVRNILRFFPPEETITFFKKIDVPLIEEKKGQCYPKTQRAKTVLEGLLKKVKDVGVILKTENKVTKISKGSLGYAVYVGNTMYDSKSVIIATGGLSYPNTGSDGSGYKIAKKYAHTTVATSPALTPLRMNKNIWTSLMGVSVKTTLTLRVDGKKHLEKETDLLFTHFGVSGLGVLDLSRHWLRKRGDHAVVLNACFLKGVQEALDVFVVKYPKKNIKSFLNEYFPQRFSTAVLTYLDLESSISVLQLAKINRKKLIAFLEAYELPITGAVGYGKAEVTAGGISFKEVHSKTLESKHSPGLFFCGEILDVDGRIGGFNFQWAWASGVVAAKGVDSYVG